MVLQKSVRRQAFVLVALLAIFVLIYNYWIISQHIEEPRSLPPPRYSIPEKEFVQRNKSFQRDGTIAFDKIFDAPTNYNPKFPWAKRGIVMCLYDHILPMGVSLLQELRSLGNYDPVQVYYCLPNELSTLSMDILLGDPLVEIIDVCSLLQTTRLFKNTEAAEAFQNFWLKPLALLYSSFEEVMLVDADDIFFDNPSRLWQTQAYESTGTLFFYDRVLNISAFFNTDFNITSSTGNIIPTTYLHKLFSIFPYKAMGIKPHRPSQQLLKSLAWNGLTAHEQDSSVVLIDKRRAGPNVLRAIYLLIAKFRFDDICYSWGDKETFWLAFEISGRPYQFSNWSCSVVSHPDDMMKHPDTLCGSLAQYWPEPQDDNSSTLFFINGQDIINPFPSKLEHYFDTESRWAQLSLNVPKHITPRKTRTRVHGDLGDLGQTCLLNAGAVPLSPEHQFRIEQRIKWSLEVAQQIQGVFHDPTSQGLYILGIIVFQNVDSDDVVINFSANMSRGWPRWRVLLIGIALVCLLYNYYALSRALDASPTTSRRYSIPEAALRRNWSSARDTTIDFDEIFGRITTYQPKFPHALRGIVVCVHTRIVPMAMSLLRELRALGNYEYVQIYHCLPDELDQEAMDMFLEDPLVEIIDICSYMTEAGYFATEETSLVFQNFWLKPLAVLFSSFNQVMLLDADDIFFENPNMLWESKAYLDTGTLFFYDRVINISMFLNTQVNVTLPSGKNQTTRYINQFFKNFYFQEAGIFSKHTPSKQLLESMVWNGHSAHEQDSSVVLIDKVRAGYWVLRVMWTLITHSRFDPICYSWGDKESFWLAFELTGIPYRFSDWSCAVVSRLNDHYISNDTLCGSLAQYHPDANSTPRVLFINGQDVINPYVAFDAPYVTLDERLEELEENIPMDVTPRHRRKPSVVDRGAFEESCLIGEGSIPLNQRQAILQRIQWANQIARELESPPKNLVVEDELDFSVAVLILIVVLVPVFFIALKVIPPLPSEQLRA